MEWFNKFWASHGERLSFGILANGLATVLWFLGMQGEAKTIYVGTAMLLFNKMRGTNGQTQPKEPENVPE